MADERTIAVYNKKAADYAKLVERETPDADLRAFMAALPPAGDVLDLGCGPGQSSAFLRDAGFRPDPVDASPGMVAAARDTHGLEARLATFEDINGEAIYDGIWANFSLLHAPRADLPRLIGALALALKPQGVFHIGMKTGEGAHRDGIDRLYTYVTTEELAGLLSDAGLSVLAVREGEEAGLSGEVAPFVIMRTRKDG